MPRFHNKEHPRTWYRNGGLPVIYKNRFLASSRNIIRRNMFKWERGKEGTWKQINHFGNRERWSSFKVHLFLLFSPRSPPLLPPFFLLAFFGGGGRRRKALCGVSSRVVLDKGIREDVKLWAALPFRRIAPKRRSLLRQRSPKSNCCINYILKRGK